LPRDALPCWLASVKLATAACQCREERPREHSKDILRQFFWKTKNTTKQYTKEEGKTAGRNQSAEAKPALKNHKIESTDPNRKPK
jgi:hypothetical protein